MFISQDILEGKYDGCYNSFIHTLKTDQDQKQLLEFMELSKVQCISAYEKRFREYEQIIASQHPSIDQNEPETTKLRRINMMYTDLNMLLSEKLQASLLFGSIVFSLCDYWLKQEKGKMQQLQLQFDRQQTKNNKHKQEVKCFAGMCKSKDDFIQQLKQRIITLQESMKQIHQVNSTNSQAQTIQDESLIDPKTSVQTKNVSSILGGSATDDSGSNECDMYAYSFGKIFRAHSILSEEEDRMIDENKEEVPIQQGIEKTPQNQVRQTWSDKISFFNSSDSHSPNSQVLNNQLNHNKGNDLSASCSIRESKKALSKSMSSFSSNKSAQFSTNKHQHERMSPSMSQQWNSSKQKTLASPEKLIQTQQNDLENMSGKKFIKEEQLFHLEIKSPRRFIIHNRSNISKKQQVLTSPNNRICFSQSQERI